MFFLTQILRIIDGLVRKLFGKRTPPPQPTRHAAPQTENRPAPEKPPRAQPAAKKSATSALPKLSAEVRYADTVWIPRVLWALAWADEQKAGPQTAAELARILDREAGLKVPPNNVARAFRDFAKDKRTKGLWKSTGKSHEITEAGKRTLAKIQ